MIMAQLVKGRAVASNVVATSDAPLNFLDKFKSYYVQAITVVGSVLVLVNTLTPVLDFVPAAKSTVTAVVAVLTAVSVFLTQNRQWVENL
jgi:low affinity Fe/Cu permease